jgi:hypothetical protein
MRLHELLSEHKKGRKAVKHNVKPRNPVAHAAQTVAKGSGPHKDKKKADKQGDVKHKSQAMAEAGSPAQQAAIAIAKKKKQGVAEGVHWQNMDPRAGRRLLSIYRDLGSGMEQHGDKDQASALYKELESAAKEEGVRTEFKNLLNSAQHSAHMDFDTNPGHFTNWFPYVGEFLEKLFGQDEEPDFELDTTESAPKGWEGTVKAMKKHKDIDNPWALAHYMKNKGYKSHKKEQVEEKKKYPFAGAKVGHKEGPAGQLRTGPARAGKLVGGGV